MLIRKLFFNKAIKDKHIKDLENKCALYKRELSLSEDLNDLTLSQKKRSEKNE